MRAPMNFTAREIEELDFKPEEKDKDDVWVWDADDGKRSGLGLRMRRGKAGTSKRWYAAYRYAGQDRRDPLGKHMTLADARAAANKILRGLEADPSKDPREAKLAAKAKAVHASTIPTFGDYAADYLLKEPTRKRWSASFKRNTERYLADGPHSAPFRKLRLDRVTKAMIASHVEQLESNGIQGATRETSAKPSKFTAQAWRDAVLRMFKAAIEAGKVTVNPVEGTRSPAPSGKKGETTRTRVLTKDELAAVWSASGDDTYGKLTKLAILLGNRRQELGGMRWSEIDDAGVWTIPKERTKTDNVLKLPLPPAALEIIRSIPCVDGQDLVFGTGTGGEYSAWSDGKERLDKRLAFEQPWVFHDLRRTLINGMHNLRIPAHVVIAVVNHAKGSTLKFDGTIDSKNVSASVHYKHYANQDDLYLDEKAEALQRWADHVLALAGKNVVPFKREGVA